MVPPSPAKVAARQLGRDRERWPGDHDPDRKRLFHTGVHSCSLIPPGQASKDTLRAHSEGGPRQSVCSCVRRLASVTVNEWCDQGQKLGASPDQGAAKTTSEVKPQLGRRIRNERQQRVRSRHSSKLSSGVPGRTPVRGLSQPTEHGLVFPQHRVVGPQASPHEGELCRPPSPCSSSPTKARRLRLALLSIVSSVCLYPR